MTIAQEMKEFATHELGHVVAFWAFGEVHEPEIVKCPDGCLAGGASYVNHRSGYPLSEDGDITPEREILARLAGGAAEYSFCDTATYDSVADAMESDLDGLLQRNLIDEETFENIFNSDEWKAAVSLVKKYEPQIRKGAKWLVKQMVLEEDEVKALMTGRRRCGLKAKRRREAS